MSELLALLDIPMLPSDDVVARAWGAIGAPSSMAPAVHRPDDGMLLAVRPSWWRDATRSECWVGERWAVVADATLYFTRDLVQPLERSGTPAPPVGAPAAHWIHAVLATWGEAGIERLEGDFAFTAWDRQERRLLAARDPIGGRTLYYAQVGTGIGLSTSLRLVRRLSGCSPEFNLVALVEDGAHLDLAVCTETAYSAVTRLPAGHALSWSPGRAARVWRWWPVPVFERGPSIPFNEGAMELRRLLVEATSARLDSSGPTAVMLSGGYDSTAVYGAAQLSGSGEQLEAISFSHRVGDPGREDELIEATTRAFGRAPRWVDAAGVDPLGDPIARARERDEPLYHTYELWNRALATSCVAAGASVALNGVGGDAWFSGSPIFLADLFRRLQWRELVREWRLHVGGFRSYALYRHLILPNLPEAALRALAVLRSGRHPRQRFYREIPDWVRANFAERSLLEERRHWSIRRMAGESLSAAEKSWFLQSPFMERIGATLARIGDDAGVELRSPLNDVRLIRFAATRPRWESNSGYENKRLLRASMTGVLPDSIVARRSARTGLPTGYLSRTLRAHAAYARPLLRSGMALADLGVVDGALVVAELEKAVTASDDWLADHLSLADVVHAELWVRSEI